MRLFSLTILLFTCHVAMAQNVPQANPQPVNAHPVTQPAAYNSVNVNYVRTYLPRFGTTDTTAVFAPGNTVQQVAQTSQYLDGLGRPLQTVGKALSPAGYDVVSPLVYDVFGRQQYTYLPYIATGTSDGNFKPAPFAGQATFYRNESLNPGVAIDSIYYGQVQYENSPLNRVLKTYSPGANWAAEGGNRPVQQQYLVNALGDSVRIWAVPTSGSIPTSTSAYTAGQLARSLVIDEQGHRVETFKDKQDRVILKKVSLTAITGGHAGWLCTYYVYDDVGNLRCVIPPQAVEAIRGNWVITQAAYDELCFRYTYDGRDRVTVKKVPGAAIVEMVYDVRDRLVYSRDGNLRAQGKWMITYYDALNRPVETALYAGTETQATLQSQLTSSGTLNPTIPAASLTPLTYTYYDNYSYTGAKAAVTAELSKPQANGNVYAEPASAVSTMTKGLSTGRKELVLGTSQWLMTSIYYDNKGRVLQTVSDNAKGGVITASNLYDFSGRLLSTYMHQTNPSATLTPDLKVLSMTHYNAAGLVDSVSNIINDDPTTRRLVTTNSYDELGRVKTTALGNLETQAFEYNIQGWLSSINKDYINGVSNPKTHFGEILRYDRGFSQSQFNGNIAGAIWRGFNDGVVRAYGFGYDTSGRLAKADYTQQATGVWVQTAMDFSVSGLTYDANGNILSMKQRGLRGTQSATIDSLVYKYLPSSNKLKYVTDNANDPASVLGDFKETAQNKSLNALDTADYAYDQNGNLITDGNKGITAISYNFLNLPEQVNIKGKGVIKFLYDASGQKLRKTVVDSTSTPVRTTVTDYLGGMVFQNDSLQFIQHPAGRVRAKIYAGVPVKYVYDYFVKDHLGSTRQVLTEESDTASYVATMETPNATTENALFSNVDATRTSAPSGFKSDQLTSPDNSVAALNAATGRKIGPALVLRVMAGDTIQVGVSAFYKSGGDAVTRRNFGAQMVSALVQALSSDVSNAGVHTESTGSLPGGMVLDSSTYNDLVKSDPDWDGKPKAYLNYVLFDDQMTLQKEASGVKQVPATPDEAIQLGSGPVVASKSGFAYIYVSNESAQEVDFNNLAVVHKTGPLLEETHYYPFGLTMAGISSNALKGSNYPENRLKYNGIELDTSMGLNAYEASYRDLDPQTGRWWQIDPKIDEDMEAWSPYASNYDNPIRYNDFGGDAPGDGVLSKVWSAAVNTFNFTRQAVNGAVVGTTDNLLGTNLRSDYGARYIHDEASARGWNTGLDAADVAGVAIGDAEITAGAGIVVAGGGATIVSGGAASPASLPAMAGGVAVAAHGLVVIGKSAMNLLNQTGRVNITPAQQKAEKLSQKDRSGQDFTKAGKEAVKDVNKEKNAGTLACENCQTPLKDSPQSKKGVPTPKDAAQVDHIVPKAKGGSGTPANGQVLCPTCNVRKSDKML
ncbi:hypothetical protein DCC81_21310 [Chitinophaga parva]|uniref:Uncharacterized protein n=1 Tax=Chitinophaga parva TaxID=2169414 RepID=A0A2T7BCY3_9BACT|nr:DUF6443 domain-containing protein [Chitinophaga parva]PUZ22956.1 hypothetical protein DCC81_21310 [Chitinophaga parva]